MLVVITALAPDATCARYALVFATTGMLSTVSPVPPFNVAVAGTNRGALAAAVPLIVMPVTRRCAPVPSMRRL